ncbi:MAG TPA: hypothetical protein VMB81_15375 [Candidatus Sulfotelmatobacter sp.]|nr:hypothetical protein [Candidatus Sulfotelmatobacter sp.]
MRTATRWLAGAAAPACLGLIGGLIVGLVGGPDAARAAGESDTAKAFTTLDQQVDAGQYAAADKTATQLLDTLGPDSTDPMVGRVLSDRARARLMQGHAADAVDDYLKAIAHADGPQDRAAGYLDLATAMNRLQLGDHACAAIRRAYDQAGSEFTPLGRVALDQSKALNCPAFADRDFARLFELPFRLGASTDGTALTGLYGDAAYTRLPTGWTIDPPALDSPDGVDARSASGDAVCAIRRSDGPAPIRTYVDAVAKEDVVRGRRPNGVLLDVNGREDRMGLQRTVEVDFAVPTASAPLPGRLELASRLDKTYAVLCLAQKPDAGDEARNVARLISESMRWRP